jgi:CheY-like chemotaxis protein
METPNAVDILLVEDNPNDAEMAMRALKKYYVANKIYHAKDGAEALDFIFGQGEHEGRDVNNKPRVILLDLKLPKVGGIEVLQKVKGDERTKRIPVVVLTSSREERDVVETYKLGVNSYIVKPVEFDKFVESVKELGFYWLLLNQPPVS